MRWILTLQRIIAHNNIEIKDNNFWSFTVRHFPAENYPFQDITSDNIKTRATSRNLSQKNTSKLWPENTWLCIKKLQHRMIWKMIFINKHSIFGKTLLTITVPITPNLTPEWTYNHGFTYGVYEGITFWNLGTLGVYFGFTKELL